MIPFPFQVGGLGMIAAPAPTDGAGAHEYWWIDITQGQIVGEGYSSIAGLEFRATPGGADQCVGGTAIADSFYAAGYEPDKAFDHDNSTEWASSVGLPHRIGYHFPVPVSVAEVAMTVTDAAYGAPNERPRLFTISWSDDGSSPTVAATPSPQGSWSNSETRLFAVP